MTSLWFALLVGVASEGEARALRSALEAGEPDAERVQGALDAAVAAAAMDAIPVLAEQFGKYYQQLREKGGEVAGLELTLATLEAKDQELRNLRKGAVRADILDDYKLKLRKEGARKIGFERVVDVLGQGFPKLLAAVAAGGDAAAMQQFLACFETLTRSKDGLEDEDEKVKGALAKAEIALRVADPDDWERLIPFLEEKANQEYLLDLLDSENAAYVAVRDSVVGSLSSLLSSLPSSARDGAEKVITAKVDKKASDADRAMYVDLFAGLGKAEGPKDVQKMYAAAERDLNKTEEDMEKLREVYARTREAWFGHTKDMKPDKDGTIMVDRRLKDSMEGAEKQLHEVSQQRRFRERAHRSTCTALAVAVRSLPEGSDKEKQFDWLLAQAGGEKSVLSRAYVVLGLGRYDRPEVRAHLRAQLQAEKDSRVRIAAVEALSSLQDREALPVLRDELLKDPDWRVRGAAIEGLRRIPDNASVPALIAVLSNEPGRLLEDANRALQHLTGQSFHWVDTIWQEWWKQNAQTFDVAAVQSRRQLALASEVAAEERDLTFYGISSPSSNVCFVLDVSGSMEEPMSKAGSVAKEGETTATGPVQKKIEVAVTELKSAIGALGDGDSFNVVIFSEAAERWKPKMTTVSEKVKTQAYKWIDETVKAQGGTNIYAGMMEAFEMAGILDERKTGTTQPLIDTIFLLSDGDPSVGEIVDPDELRRTLRDFNEFQQVHIHAIGVGDANATFLYGLAEDSGGLFVKR